MPRFVSSLLLLAGCFAFQAAHATTISGDIKVTSVVNQNTIGFLQLTGPQDRYIVGSSASADTFQLNVFTVGITTGVSPMDTNAPASHPFLAGLIAPGVELLTSNSNAAIIGDAPVTTAPGSTPQSGGSVSIPGSEYETAIWTFNASTETLGPGWVNHSGSQPAMSLVWDPVGQTLYLTANPAAVILNHPGAQSVNLTFTGTISSSTPEPSTLVLLSSAMGGLAFVLRKRILTRTN